MFNGIIENMKIIGICVGALTACVGGYTTLGGPIPASRTFVLAQYDSLKGRVIDGQIQTNSFHSSILKQEQVSRSADVTKETNPQVRSIYQNRLNEVTDELNQLHSESDNLFREKAMLSK